MTDLETRLRAVDRVPGPDVWERVRSRAVRLPPGGGELPTPPPPTRQRVIAAVVAFVVFGAAAVLALEAFGYRGEIVGDTPPAPGAVTFSFEAGGTEDSGHPRATMSVGGEEISGQHLSYSWAEDGGVTTVETIAPDLRDRVAVSAGAPILVEGNAEDVRGWVDSCCWDSLPPPRLYELDLAGAPTMPSEGSRYVLEFSARWPQGVVTYLFPIQIVYTPTPSIDPDPSPGRSEVTYLADDERWAPSTYSEGDRTVMPVTFPDGTTAELVYPAGAALEAMSVAPATYADGPQECGSSVGATRHDPQGGWVRGSAPLVEFAREDGQMVGLWQGTRDHEPHDSLVYRFGSWTVLVPCRFRSDRTDTAQIAAWAENLSGRESEDGLLILEGSPPVILHPYRDIRSAPAIRFSDADAVIDLSATDGCLPPSEAGDDRDAADGVAQWCVQPDAGIYLYANGWNADGKQLLRDLIAGLEIRRVVPPG